MHYLLVVIVLLPLRDTPFGRKTKKAQPWSYPFPYLLRVTIVSAQQKKGDHGCAEKATRNNCCALHNHGFYFQGVALKR